MKAANTMYLASASPRRRLLLEEAGIDVQVHPPDIDDGLLRPGSVSAEQWVMALAYLKAKRVADMLVRGDTAPRAIRILAADTVCAAGNRLLGQPRDAAHARWMIESLQNDVHRTLTGVCLLTPGTMERLLLVDQAEVRIGKLNPEQLDRYIASEKWRGKAGGYNLAEQVEAGWPIECTGDPATVMGLPMRRLTPILRP